MTRSWATAPSRASNLPPSTPPQQYQVSAGVCWGFRGTKVTLRRGDRGLTDRKACLSQSSYSTAERRAVAAASCSPSMLSVHTAYPPSPPQGERKKKGGTTNGDPRPCLQGARQRVEHGGPRGGGGAEHAPAVEQRALHRGQGARRRRASGEAGGGQGWGLVAGSRNGCRPRHRTHRVAHLGPATTRAGKMRPPATKRLFPTAEKGMGTMCEGRRGRQRRWWRGRRPTRPRPPGVP